MNMALVLTVLLLMPGLILAFVPVIPAILYLFIVVLGYAIVSHFTHLSGGEFALLTGIAVLSFLVDHLSGLIGARWGGASRRAMLFGFIGAILGALSGGPLMSFVGLFAGIFVTEVLQLRPHIYAFRAATGGVIGALVGYGINIVIAFLFVGLFLFFALH